MVLYSVFYKFLIISKYLIIFGFDPTLMNIHIRDKSRGEEEKKSSFSYRIAYTLYAMKRNYRADDEVLAKIYT